MRFSIITDSASDLQSHIKSRDDEFVVPTTVIIGSEAYDDGEIEYNEFIQLLKKENVKTRQPSLSNYEKYYQLALDYSETNAVLGIHLSKNLTGTHNAALTVTEPLEGNFYHIDSENLSFGVGYLIDMATRLKDDGMELDEIVRILNLLKKEIKLEIIIDSIDHLLSSGGVNIGISLFLKIFGLKPILSCIDGKLERIGMSFGKERGLMKIINHIRQYDAGDNPVIMMGYADTPEAVATIKSHLKDFSYSEIYLVKVCPVIMTHSGPGVFGIGIGPSYGYIKNM